MYHKKDKQLDQIASLITAFATGDYDRRINTKYFKDKNLVIAVLLNMLGGKLKNVFPNISPDNNTSNLQHLIFIINQELNVIDYNSSHEMLICPEALNSLYGFLDHYSVKKIQELFSSQKFEKPLHLNFKLKDDLIATLDSKLSPLSIKSDVYILSSVRKIPLTELKKLRLEKLTRSTNLKFDIKKNKDLLEKAYHYLMDNLHKPFPGMDNMTEFLDTNPTLLKRGFPLLYGSTMARFHLIKRLEKARELLKGTDTVQSKIGDLCGFKSDAHFSRAFKKHFGIPPSKCR
ncbi:helix-turn-helix domain-containing protein [Salegentibacter agarivorans]